MGTAGGSGGGTTGEGVGGTGTGGTVTVGSDTGGTNTSGTGGSSGMGTGGGGMDGTACTDACTTGTTCLSGTSLETCAAGANGCTALSTSACGGGLVCERTSTAACLDPTWAEWPMPNGSAAFPDGAPNAATYADNGDGTVTDLITGLMWQQTLPKAMYDWVQAIAYCPTLALGGHGDWRLPSRIELFSIVAVATGNASIDARYFPTTPSGAFWSSSPVAASPGAAWAVDFGSGSSYYYVSTDPHDVRCVR
ncbi:MAG TPA: DUF1566 domain-containing protein [Polyangia bacterium]|nr:DUF1566 domain-containing protein [Polyangia bacterium]